MKVAVIGDGPIALQQTLKINELGGHGVWFDTCPETFNWLNQCYPDLVTKTEKELIEAKENLIANRQYCSDKLLRVTKKFLMPGETLPGKSRFVDLFRVVVQRKTDKNLLEDPDKIAPEILNNLKKEIEVYFDFDVILDCQSGFHDQHYLGGNTFVVGEAFNEAQKKICYGVNSLLEKNHSEKEILLVGTTSLAADFILKNIDFIKKEDTLFFWSSHFEHPIEALLESASLKQQEKLQELFNWVEQDYTQQKENYKKKYEEWSELEDYMKAKVKEPDYPIAKIVIFSGHTATAVNKLIDQDKIYVSIEKPDFKTAKVQLENAELQSKTMSVDKVISVTDPYRKKQYYYALDIGKELKAQPEKGVYFFPLVPALSPKDLGEFEIDFTSNLLKWFSPAETH